MLSSGAGPPCAVYVAPQPSLLHGSGGGGGGGREGGERCIDYIKSRNTERRSINIHCTCTLPQARTYRNSLVCILVTHVYNTIIE